MIRYCQTGIQVSKAEIEQSLVRMLERREYAEKEAQRKLVSKGHDATLVSEVIAEYVARGWLSDERFTLRKVESLQSRGYGPLYVKSMLAQYGLNVDLKAYDWQVAYAVAKRKAGSKQGMALRQYLYRRGFSYDSERNS